jgi:hypothetical protein
VDSATPTSASVIEVRGRGLSKDASFLIDGKDVTTGVVVATNGPCAPAASMSPESTALVKELTLTFAAPPTWPSSGGKALVLTVVNPDGQRAEWPIAFFPAASTSVAPPAIPPPATSSPAIPSPA